MKQVQLVRLFDNKTVFDAAYVKYFPNPDGPGMLPYCALFDEYPAIETTIKLCKKVEVDAAQGNMNACRLVSQGKDVGFYIPLATVHSEKEATNRVNANYRGMMVLRATTNRQR